MNRPFCASDTTGPVAGVKTGLGRANAAALAKVGAGIASVGPSDPFGTEDAVRAPGSIFRSIEADRSPIAPIADIRNAAPAGGALDVGAAVFLASSVSGDVNGIVLPVGGGRLAR